MKIHALSVAGMIVLLLCLGCSAITADTSTGEGRLYRGELLVLIADDFTRQTSETHYQLISAEDGAILGLAFLHSPPEPALPSGVRVEIRGIRHDARLTVESLRVLPGASSKP